MDVPDTAPPGDPETSATPGDGPAPVALTDADVKPLDIDGVGAVAFGTIAWTVALVVCLLLRGPLADAGRGWWAWVCVAGALLGLAGLGFVRRRRDAYAQARPH